ncbi:hypothetical protein [Flavobacterium sp.]|uniref:hypothetical protein n=1 Tax=Flavobacterium sp. TaxID=239 RepID=UPI0039E52DF3
MGNDFGIDGKYFNDSDLALYSLANEEHYVIQGRPFPFDPSDVVPLGFAAATAGAYTIAIDHTDGLFAADQEIWLRDNLTSALHDLKSGAYDFASEAGTFESRFEIVYTNPLGTNHEQWTSNSVVLYKDKTGFTINSGKAQMKQVQVYDVRGRLLKTVGDIQASEINIPLEAANQVLVFKIQMTDNVVVTRKAIH